MSYIYIPQFIIIKYFYLLFVKNGKLTACSGRIDKRDFLLYTEKGLKVLQIHENREVDKNLSDRADKYIVWTALFIPKNKDWVMDRAFRYVEIQEKPMHML